MKAFRIISFPMALFIAIMHVSCLAHKENELLAKLDVIPENGVLISIDLPYRGVAWRLSVALDGKVNNAGSEILIELVNESEAILKLTLPEETVFTRIGVGQKEPIWRGGLKELRETPVSIPFSFLEPQNKLKRLKMTMLIRSSSPVRFMSEASIIVRASSTDGF